MASGRWRQTDGGRLKRMGGFGVWSRLDAVAMAGVAMVVLGG